MSTKVNITAAIIKTSGTTPGNITITTINKRAGKPPLSAVKKSTKNTAAYYMNNAVKSLNAAKRAKK